MKVPLLRSLISIFCLAFAGQAMAAEYCVREVPLPGFRVSDLSSAKDIMWFERDAQVTPGAMKAYPGASFPVISRAIQVPEGQDRKRYREVGQLLWGVDAASVSLSGPYEIAGLNRLDGPAVNRNDGSVLFVGFRQTKDGIGLKTHGSDKTFQYTLYRYDFRGPPTEMPGAVQAALQWPGRAVWSQTRNGYLITSYQMAEPGIWNRRVSLLRGDTVTQTRFRDIEMSAFLPQMQAEVLLERGTLHVLDKQGRVRLSRPLNSGDDYNGWNGIRAVRDNWIYVDGAQYDHALHLNTDGETWLIDRIVRFFEPFDNLVPLGQLTDFDQRQIERGGLDGLFRVGKCRAYSPALQQLFFCQEQKALADGALKTVDGDIRMDWHAGDIPFLGVTLFWGKNDTLYSYDGTRAQRIVETPIERGILTVLPISQRIFYATQRSGVFELRQQGSKLVPSRVDLDHPGFFTRFFELDNGEGVFAVTRRSISRLTDETAQIIWRAKNPIDTTGHTSPIQNASLQGVLFTTQAGRDGTFKLHVLRQCVSSK
ncbi:MAG: hypothetical protein AAGJ28_04535 [Pseudomonadota bacterium]